MTNAVCSLDDEDEVFLGENCPDQFSLFAPEEIAPVRTETFGPPKTENLYRDTDSPAPILAMTQADLNSCFHEAVVLEFGSKRAPTRQLADAAGSNIRAAKNWYEGNNTPDLLHALKLAVTVPAWRAELRRILAMDAALDPDVERALSDLVRRFPSIAKGAR